MTDLQGTNVNKWLISVTVMLGTIMSALDTSIVNVALPYMRGNLGASVEEITWVASGYILSTVIVMPAIAFLSGRFGRKRFYIFSIVTFTLSSVLCGFAWDLNSLIFFRVLQGLGGGALMPISQAILRETFPPKEQGLAMGIYGAGVVIGPAIGPALGGWLTDNFSWPWIFFINLPIGILNLWMAGTYIKDPSYLVREKGKVDWLGLGLMTLGFTAMQIVFEKGNDKGWFESSFIVRFSITAVLAMALFTWRELACSKPAVNLRLFKDINFTVGTLIGAVFGLCLYSTLFLQPLFLQQSGYSAYEAGMILIPRSLVMAFSMPLAGQLYNRLGPRWIIWGGLVITVLSYYQFARLTPQTSGMDLLVPQLLQGTGFGLIFVALSTAVLSTIEKPLMTAAVGLYNVIRQVFGSIGIAIAATLLTQGQINYRTTLITHITAYNSVSVDWFHHLTGAMRHAGMDIHSSHQAALNIMSNEVNRQAQVLSFNYVFSLMAIIFAMSMLMVFSFKDTTHKQIP